jgi:hypothetical protein
MSYTLVGIWSNENGPDNLCRDGKDIHEAHPGEEVNFHGYLNGTAYKGFGANYGFPKCTSVWQTSGMPRASNLRIGKQFLLYEGRGPGLWPMGNTCGPAPAAITAAGDASCDQYMPPKLTLPPHWAPIDFKFNTKGTVASMTSRGSWYVAEYR